MNLTKVVSPLIALVFLLLVYACSEDADTGQTIRFNQDWSFYKPDTIGMSSEEILKMESAKWGKISLPVFLNISEKVNFDIENILLVRLDNRNNPEKTA